MSAPFAMNFLDKNPMLKHVFNIWMQPVYGRLNLEGKKTLWLLLSAIPLLVIAIYLLLQFSFPEEISARKISLIALAGIAADFILLLAFWFIFLAASAAQQYSPANASLVPYLRRNLQWALALPILVLPIIPAVAFYFKDNQFSALIWLCGVMVMLVLVASVRNRWMGFIFAAAMQLPMLLRGKGGSFESLKIFNQPALLIPFGLLLIAVVLHWIFAKGDHLFKRREQINQMQEAMKGNAKWNLSGVQRLFAFAYLSALKRHLHGATYAVKRVELLPFALGPQVHWSSVFFQTVGFALLMSLYVFFVGNEDISEAKNVSYLLIPLLTFLVMPIAYIAQIQSTIYQTRGGQNLLSLSPAISSNAMQTQVLLSYVMRQYFFLLGIIFMIAVLTCEWLVPDDQIRHTIYLACFSTLPLSISIVRNYAKMQSASDTQMVRTLLSWFALLSASLSIVYFVPLIPYWMVCSVIFILTAAILRARWNKLMRLDAVFPAGRAV